jgi:type IV pilus assembly protein PilZ
MDDASNAERRGGNRAPIELKVEYKRKNTFFSDYTRNISKGGTFIRTDRPLPVGTEFIFALTIPGLDEPLRLKGRVQWISPPEGADERGTGMGIEFVYKEASEHEAVAKVVEGLMAKELGEGLSQRMLGRPDGGRDA